MTPMRVSVEGSRVYEMMNVRQVYAEEYLAEGWDQYHETQITPLVEKVSVDIDTVWFAQVLGDDGADGRQIFSF